jgi:hypothetical protein
MIKSSKLGLRREYKQTTQELATLNRELASQMILLASQTGDTEPLIHAVSALRTAEELYPAETSPRENAEIRQALADTLLTLGRANNDIEALENAITAYRDAITLASLLGDQKLRKALKRNYGTTRNLLSQNTTSAQTRLRGAA